MLTSVQGQVRRIIQFLQYNIININTIPTIHINLQSVKVIKFILLQ